jgi:hypothetical protein
MSDDKTKRGPRDADRVNVNEDYEVRYWTKKWGVTEAQLKDAVRRAGLMARDVAKALGKP